MAKKSCARNSCGVLQSILVAAILYGFLYIGVLVVQRGSFPKSPKELYKNPPAIRPGSSSSDSVGQSTGVRLPSAKLKVELINSNANWFNRPESLVVPRDDYMGKRPNVDTVANLTRLVNECRGSYENIEKMPYVYDCLNTWRRARRNISTYPHEANEPANNPPNEQST